MHRRLSLTLFAVALGLATTALNAPARAAADDPPQPPRTR